MRHLPPTLIALLLLIAGSDPTSAVELQPHSAVYRMSLAPGQPTSEVVSADGAMSYRLSRECDGWTVENRTALRVDYEDDTETNTLWTFASWESSDGLHMRFRARFDQDGQTVEKLEGEANLPAVGKPGTARFSQPSDQIVDLPAGTIFPTEHVREMIAAALDGRHHLTRVVFDGASVDNPFLVSAVFGPLPVARAEELAKGMGLPLQPAWWTQVAFFPYADQRDALPDFAMDAFYRGDGIADHILQRFDDFSLDLRLNEVKLLPAPDC